MIDWPDAGSRSRSRDAFNAIAIARGVWQHQRWSASHVPYDEWWRRRLATQVKSWRGFLSGPSQNREGQPVRVTGPGRASGGGSGGNYDGRTNMSAHYKRRVCGSHVWRCAQFVCVRCFCCLYTFLMRVPNSAGSQRLPNMPESVHSIASILMSCVTSSY